MCLSVRVAICWFPFKGNQPENRGGSRKQKHIFTGGQHDIRFRKEKHNPELNRVFEINDELDRHGGTNPCVVGGAFDGVNREVALCTPALGCSNSARNDSRPHDVVSRGLAGSMIQLAGSISRLELGPQQIYICLYIYICIYIYISILFAWLVENTGTPKSQTKQKQKGARIFWGRALDSALGGASDCGSRAL